MKLGEKIIFGISLLVVVAGVQRGLKHFNSTDVRKPKDYYVWTEASLEGHTVYRRMGCNNCHRAMGVGEMGVAPVLDGTGTRRSQEWLHSYFRDPASLVPGTAHDGSLGPDFRKMADKDRDLVAAFLYALRANPGSPNYPVPPPEALVQQKG